MSWLKKLFGGSSGPPPPGPKEDYNGYVIEPTPYPEGGQYQVCGMISKSIAGEAKTHRFVRADRFATLEEATTFSVVKAKQIIDQNGDRLFG